MIDVCKGRWICSKSIQEQILVARAKKIAWDLYQESPHSSARLLGADNYQKIVTYEFYLPKIPFNYDVSKVLANLVQKYYDEYYNLKRQH